jgi:ribosomal protein S12 methylthiotransferase
MKKVFISAYLGCEKRKLDAKRIADYFLKNGYMVTTDPKDADVIVLSSCGGTEYMIKRGYSEIKRFESYKKDLIVTGCLPEAERKTFSKKYHGKFMSSKNLNKIDELFPENKISFNEIQDSNLPWITLDDTKFNDTIRKLIASNKITKQIFLKIVYHMFNNIFGDGYLLFGNQINIPQDNFYLIRLGWGCSKNCSYCVIGRTTGPARSKAPEKCIGELQQAINNGYSNILLVAKDIGAYGIDNGVKFPEILDNMTNLKGNYKLIIFGLNPYWLIKYIEDLEKILKKEKIAGISIPIQSGNKRILKLMNRSNDREKMLDAFIRIKNAYPKIKFRTTGLVGFPSETEEEFFDTLDFITQASVDMGDLYGISLRPDTKAVTNP